MQTAPPSRHLGLSVFGALAILSWMLFGWTNSILLSAGIVSAGAVFTAVYYAVPSAQQQLADLFHQATYPIRWSMTWVTMILLYYFVVTPIGIWYRMSGKSIHHRSQDSTSNWHEIEHPSDPDTYFRSY